MKNTDDKIYGRKIIRNGTQKRVMHEKDAKTMLTVLLIAALVIGILIGTLGGWFLFHTDETTGTEDPVQITEDTKTYGTADGRVFTGEVKWTGKNAPDFTPMNVDMDEDLQEYVFDLCYCYNLDWTFVMAVIEHESQYEAGAISSTNDYGLMQINKANFEWLTKVTGVTDFLNAKDNIRCGVFVIRKLFEKYDDPSKVLMAYNMGEGGAGKLWNMGIYESEYSQDVLTIQERMKGELKND